MTTFKNKLKGIISESATIEFMNSIVDTPEAFENNDPETLIVAAGPLHGMNFISSTEGIITFSTYKKSSLESFCAFLDTDESVEGYSISVVTSDPYTKIPEHSEGIDYELVQENDFVEFFIDVVILNELTKYNPYYYGDTEESEDDFIYPLEQDDSFLDPFGSEYVDYNAISTAETPLLVKLANTVSASPYGKFMVTVHPNDSSKILIQVNYSTFPIREDVLSDIEKINHGDFGFKFNDVFTLTSEASYIDGELSTIAAVYSANDNVDATTIMECFEDIREILYSNELNEVERVTKVNFKGRRRFKMQCKPGFKYDPTRKACVLISGSEKSKSRLSHRQMARTKRALGTGYKRKIFIKVRRAKKFRKLMGI